MSDLVPIKGLVSVIVASYNHAEFLAQRLNGILNQTYQNYEIIVIDDFSNDGSSDILSQYKNHPKVQLVFQNENRGWVETSNIGFELSKGEFVIFANCDDDCDPQLLTRLVAKMNEWPSTGICFSRSTLVNDKNQNIGNDFSGRELKFRSYCSSDTFIKRDDMKRFLLDSCVIPNLSAALFRRDCFVRCGKFSNTYRVCCDWDLFFRVTEFYDFGYVSAELNKFRQHPTTIRSATKDRIVYEEYFRLLLGQIKIGEFSPTEKYYFRYKVMRLWSLHLISRYFTGLGNFWYHFNIIRVLDSRAMFVLPFAIFTRVLQAGRKALLKLSKFSAH